MSYYKNFQIYAWPYGLQLLGLFLPMLVDFPFSCICHFGLWLVDIFLIAFASHNGLSFYVLYLSYGWLFMECFVWHFGEYWVCSATLDQFLLTSFVGFGRRKEAKSLWHCAIYAIVWSIWLEFNSCTFNDRFLDKHVLWDRVRHLASSWCKAHNLFRGISLSDMLRDWKLCFIDIFLFCLFLLL